MAAGSAWTDSETFKLIELWGDQTIQEQLEGCKKNKQVFQKISEQMREAGYERTLSQCRDKIKKLRGDYRKIKDAIKETGNENKRKKSKYFEKMNEVLHDKHSITPPVILDTSASASTTNDLEEVSEIEKEEDITDETVGDKNSTKDDVDREAKDNGETAVVKKDDDMKPKITAGVKRKKQAKYDKIEQVIEKMYGKISSQQAESDRIFADLEEKRMKLEHEMLKMQQDRQREESERAERQRREDREFQLRMITMMYGQQQYPNAAMYSGQQYYPPSAYGTSSEATSDSDYHNMDSKYYDPQ